MKRRGHSEGSIYQRADGRWAAVIDLGWHAGKRTRRSTYHRTRKAAHEALTRALRDVEQGVQPGSRRETVGAYLIGWIEQIRGDVRPSTWRRYEQIVRNQLIPHLGKLRLARLTPTDVEAMLRELDVSPRTAHHVKAVARAALARAVRHGLVMRNAAALAAAPHAKRREIQALSPEEVRRLLAAIGGHRYEALFTLAVSTGMRLGELLAVRWPDVHPTGRTLRVSHTLQWIGGVAQLGEPKTARSRRTVQLPEVALRTIETLPRTSVYVFCNDRGGPLHPATAYHALQRVLAGAGLPRVSFHALRHSYASALLAQGVHPRIIMEALGHSQISLTMNTYAHVIPALERDAADQMDRLLGS